MVGFDTTNGLHQTPKKTGGDGVGESAPYAANATAQRTKKATKSSVEELLYRGACYGQRCLVVH